MSDLTYVDLEYKIARPESVSLIGSNYVNTSGDLYIIDVNSIYKTNNKRNKRFLDIIISLHLIALWPLTVVFVKRPLYYLKNILLVLFGIKSWIGYNIIFKSEEQKLPNIKKGVLFPIDAFKNKKISNEANFKLNLLYARDYRVLNDLNILLKGFENLGRK